MTWEDRVSAIRDPTADVLEGVHETNRIRFGSAAIVPATTHSELYLALIERDKALTVGIRERRVTRAQREAQIALLRERILAYEQDASDRLRSGLTEPERGRRREFLMKSTRDLLYGRPI